MQLHLKIPPTKIFLFSQTCAVFFPRFFKYHVVFHYQSEDYIGEDDIIDMIEVIVL